MYIIKLTIKLYENKEHTALEIGCGGGIWCNKLIEVFKEVYALDIIRKQEGINNKIIYYQLEDLQDYTCSPIADNSIDFVWCFGVFCHMPESAITIYIKNILRILKSGGNAIIMFANWENHEELKHNISISKLLYREVRSPYTWFYMDKETVKKIMNKNGIIEYEDLIPDFRDTIIHFKK